MGRLHRIEEIINGTLSHYSHIKIFPRGLPRFIDPLLRGIIRFGKRTGNSIAVINTDNTHTFGTPPQKGSDRFDLSFQNEWLTLGSILSMGPGRELVQVQDISGTTIILSDTLKRAYTNADRVLNYAYPIEMQVDAVYNDTILYVRSHYKLANGDVFSYLQTDGLIESLSEIEILEAEFAGTSADPFFTYLYNLTIASGVARPLTTTSQVFIRAYPAYFSAAVKVPNSLESSEPIGPFLLDVMSGNLIEGVVPKETFSMKALNRTGLFVIGTSDKYITVQKNFVIGDRPWSAHTLMFWQLAEGVMRITPNRVLMRVNNRRLFCAGQKCIPPYPSGKSWRVSLISNDDCTIRFIFDPHPFQEFTLNSGIPLNANVIIPTGAEIQNFEINVLSTSTICEVSMSDWTPNGDTVESLEYAYMVQSTGEAHFQSSGLILKPYFLSTDLLRSSYDSGANADGGKIYF